MKKTKLFKSLLVAAALLMGASAWAASALTASFKVTGYEKSHFFDFVNRDFDGTSYTSNNDLPNLGVTAQATIQEDYAANTWYYYNGLRNQCGGGRWISFPVEIKADDYIIINGAAASEAYEISMTDGTSTTITEASDYLCFKANKDMTQLKLTVHRYNYISQILIMTKSASAQTADYTINYVCNSETVKSSEGNAVVGSSVATEASFWANDVKYIRNDGEAESVTIKTTDNTFTVNVHQAPKYTYTLNAVDGDNNLLKVLGSGEQYEDENAVVYFNKAIFVNDKWYITDAVGNWVLHKDYTSANITFTEDATISYFIEVEDINTSHAWADGKGDYPDHYSNGKIGRLFKDSYAYTDALEGGVYTITLKGRNHAGSTTANVAVYVRDAEGNETKCHNQFEEWGKGVEGAKDVMIEIPNGYSLEFKNEDTQWNSNLEMDYLILRKSGINTMSIVGFTPESGLNDADKWNPAKGFAMTRDADDPSIWTAVVDKYIITGSGDSELKYYYKAAANGTFDGYRLPNEGNQNYNFNYAEAGAGMYKLTFTANTFKNEVSLAIEKLVTGQVYFVNTNDWADVKIWVWDKNNSDYNYTGGTFPGVAMTKIEEQVDGHDVYTWSTYDITGTPTTLIISNGGSDTERTGDQTFVNGATYKADGSSTETKTITAAGYATFCSSRPVDFSSATGLTAYIAKKDEKDANKVVFTPVTKVPAETGVLLKGAAGSYTISSTWSEELDDVTDNALVGVTVDTQVAPGAFVLMNGGKGVGFYKTTKTFTVGANTAYIAALPEPQDGNARTFIGFNFDDTTTAIEGVATVKMNDGEIYNLQGQRVSAATKGLYIVNGKKVLVK